MTKTNEKRNYVLPEIIQVKLDNEISLQLQSPPSGPTESIKMIAEAANKLDVNPFK